MASDVGRIAEVLTAHQCVYGECSCGQEFGRVQDTMAQHQAEQLAAAGFGHVPTALHQAADALDYAADVASYETGPGLDEAEKIVRARADRAGREAHAS